jgi:hypothetical protein
MDISEHIKAKIDDLEESFEFLTLIHIHDNRVNSEDSQDLQNTKE